MWLDVLPVLMTKRPTAGGVKTRLAERYGHQDAARIARAMLRCTIERLAARGPFVVAVSPDGAGPELAACLGLERPPETMTVIDQGPGDLGRRLDRVWNAVGRDRAVAFLGADAPDVPAEHLAAIAPALAGADVAAGPTPDGGYWTLAAAVYAPQVLDRIDWGTGTVYDQTRRRAAESGLRFATLPVWHDVDRPEDVDALRERLSGFERATTTDARPLRSLADRLASLCSLTRPSGPPR